jgi:trk system potassium uptake protein TrkH
MMQARDNLTPRRTRYTWLAAAVLAATGLALRHGELDRIGGLIAPGPTATGFRILLVAAAGVFAISQLLMILPTQALGERLGRWWPNFLAIIGAVVWWWQDRSREWLILDLIASYILVVGAWSIARAGLHALTQGGGYGRFQPAGWRLLVAAVLLTALAGTILSLPVCWKGTYPVNWDNTYPNQTRSEYRAHWLDCTFTAAAALTGTGLAVRDIGCEFGPTGHVVILVLMQVGALAVLAIGASAVVRLRRLVGWGAPDDDISPCGIRRLIVAVFALAFVLEAAGAFALYTMWNPDTDANLAAGGDRLLASAFHAVSALGNVGLTLTGDSMIAYRDQTRLYAVILPLMVLGGIGGPVLLEVGRRLLRRHGLGLGSLSGHSAFTVMGTAVLLVGVAGLLVGIESTPDWQLRNPRVDTPGRLMLPDAGTQPAGSRPTTLASLPSVQERVRSQRMATMNLPDRVKAAVFQSASARTAGLRTCRLDEPSLSPASRWVLMAAMLVGADAGGTAGGLRLTILLLLLTAIRFSCISPSPSKTVCPAAGRHHAIAIAAGLAVAFALLVAATAFVLIYRETGSPAACLFEAVSACCNVGFSTGLTGQLSFEGRITVILAMLIGRVIPLAFLLRSMRVPLVQLGPTTETAGQSA